MYCSALYLTPHLTVLVRSAQTGPHPQYCPLLARTTATLTEGTAVDIMLTSQHNLGVFAHKSGTLYSTHTHTHTNGVIIT